MSRLQYPNLANCKVTLRPETGMDRPPVRLPGHILSSEPVDEPYDFSLEKKILRNHEERERGWKMSAACSRQELEQNVLARMKSVTKANDDVCISLLKSNSYDLKESIEAFLSK